MSDDYWSVAQSLARSGGVEGIARDSAELVLGDIIRCGGDPRRYDDASVRRRAARDVVYDLAGDALVGFSHSEDEAWAYEERYVAAYLVAWRDEELLGRLEAKVRSAGFVIVCLR